MLHQLPKNVFSSHLVSTLAITTHPPRCCEDHAPRLVADKLANGKEPKEARRPAPHNRYRDWCTPVDGMAKIADATANSWNAMFGAKNTAAKATPPPAPAAPKKNLVQDSKKAALAALS